MSYGYAKLGQFQYQTFDRDKLQYTNIPIVSPPTPPPPEIHDDEPEDDEGAEEHDDDTVDVVEGDEEEEDDNAGEYAPLSSPLTKLDCILICARR
jgi:hypothetical protein